MRYHFGRLWYGEPHAISNAIGYAKFRRRLHRALIRIYDEAGNVIETHEHASQFKEPFVFSSHHVALPARTKFPMTPRAAIGRSRGKQRAACSIISA
jgi:hypothetical protein